MSMIAPPLRIGAWLSVALVALASESARAETPSAEGACQLALLNPSCAQWDTITFAVDCQPQGVGSEAEASAAIDVAITTPSGLQLAVPTFPASGNVGDGRYLCRFTPREVGSYTATIATAGNDDPRRDVLTFQVSEAADRRGFLHIEQSQPYFLSFDDGSQFRGIGINIGWEPRRRRREQHTYDALFPRIAAHGMNTVRTWICPWNLSLDWRSRPLGTYDERALRRLDEMFALAEKYGIYIVLVLGYHGELQTETGSFPGNDRWKENPYHVANGGPCKTPAEFFTSERAKALYKKRIRLLVARAACQSHLLAWEFWNEIDHIERRGPVPAKDIVAWHQEMAGYLRSIDPYDHPITTSASVKAPPGLWEVDDLDLIMLHPYGRTDRLATLLAKTNSRYRKPVVAGEFSYSWKPATKEDAADFERELRLGLWRGLMSPTPVLPMTWWWEFHDAHDDWRFFRPVASISHRMTQLNESPWRPVRAEVANDFIECQGIAVGSNVFLWLRNRGNSDSSNVIVSLPDVNAHDYEARQFSTHTGEQSGEDRVSLNVRSGVLTLSVPSLPVHGDTMFMLSK